MIRICSGLKNVVEEENELRRKHGAIEETKERTKQGVPQRVLKEWGKKRDRGRLPGEKQVWMLHIVVGCFCWEFASCCC